MAARCGLTVNQRRIMSSVLITHMDDRGGDSFGYYKSGHITKDVGTAAFGANIEDIARSRAVFLHTRKATVGDVSQPNAHPFRSEGIVGCHNGGVSNHRELNHRLGRDFDVDSMHIFAQIAENLPLEDLRASGAIVFVDENDNVNKHYLCRFNGGSLVIAGIGLKDNPEAVVFASTRSAVESALDLARVGDYFWYKTEEGVLYWAIDGTLKVHTPEHRLRFNDRWPATGYHGGLRVTDKRRVVGGGAASDYPPFWQQGTGHTHTPANIPGLDGAWEAPDEEEGDPTTRKVIDISTSAAYTYNDFKKSETGQATKHFIATRKKALQGFYKDKRCSFCRLLRANVTCTLTSYEYCMNCWKLVERCSPFSEEEYRRLIVAYSESTDIIAAASKREAGEDSKDDPYLCDFCYEEPPLWYDKVTQVLVGKKCYVERKYQIGDVVLLAGYGTVPEATPCEVCDVDFAVLKHVSFAEGKTMDLCLECFKNEVEVDDSKRLEFIKGEGNKAGTIKLLGAAPSKMDEEEEGKVSKLATSH
jgi:hypothetical protein